MDHVMDIDTHKSNQAFILTSMDKPLLSREHEQSLARAWRDEHDEAAMHELVEAYGRMVISMASRFRHYGLPLSDLIQEGNVGLMLAALRFDPNRDVRFSTYACWWVRSMLQDYVLRNWSIVRTGVTTSHKSLFFNLRRLRAQIASVTGDSELTNEGRLEIAGTLGVTVKEVEMMEMRLSAGDQSLNQSLDVESGDERQDFLVDNAPSPEQIAQKEVDHKRRSEWINQALASLNQREQIIIRERCLCDESVTLEQIGRELGVSKERVRQLEIRALAKLKSALNEIVREPQDLLESA